MHGGDLLSCLSGEHNRELVVLAVTAAQALSKGRDSEETARLATFFTILGDTLALFALDAGDAGKPCC